MAHAKDAMAGRTLATSRVFAATPADVFAAFRDPGRLARWWGPAGFTDTTDVFEFRPGGAWKHVMHGPDGTDYPNLSEFAAIEPERRVVIRHLSAPRFELDVTLEAQGAGTRLDWRQCFDEAAVCAAVRHICIPANEQNLDRLAAELSRACQPRAPGEAGALPPLSR